MAKFSHLQFPRHLEGQYLPSNYPVYCFITGDHLLAGISLGRSLPSTGFSALGRKEAGLLGPAATVLYWAPLSPSLHLSLTSFWPYTKASSSACTNDAGSASHTRATPSHLISVHLSILCLLSVTMKKAPPRVSLPSDPSLDLP